MLMHDCFMQHAALLTVSCMAFDQVGNHCILSASCLSSSLTCYKNWLSCKSIHMGLSLTIFKTLFLWMISWLKLKLDFDTAIAVSFVM